MNNIEILDKGSSINNRSSFKKSNFKYNSRDLPIVKYLVADLNVFLSDFAPISVAEKISLEAKHTFNYFLDKSIVDVYLFLTERNTEWKCVFKVCPNYFSKKENFLKIDEYLNNGVMIFDLKKFYLETIKKYNI